MASTYDRTATAWDSSSWNPQSSPCGPAPPRLPHVDGDSPGTVSATYSSSGSVFTVRAAPVELYVAVSVPRSFVLCVPATHSVRNWLAVTGLAVGFFAPVPTCTDHGAAPPGSVPAHVSAVWTFHVPAAAFWNRTAGAFATPGADTPPADATMTSSVLFSVIAIRTVVVSVGTVAGLAAAASAGTDAAGADNAGALAPAAPTPAAPTVPSRRRADHRDRRPSPRPPTGPEPRRSSDGGPRRCCYASG